MKLVYSMKDKPPFGKNLIYGFQQLLAIIAATVLVPFIVNSNAHYQLLSQSAALIGAGVGSLIYIAFTRMKSPVFLGSSFAFIAPVTSAVIYGYCGIILGSLFAGIVYVLIALIIKFVGSNWIDKLMPPVIIGPTVALIGLSLSSSAINNVNNTAVAGYNLWCILIGIITFLVTVIVSVKGNKSMKLIPFVIGVLAGYVAALLITLVGYKAFGFAYCKIVDFSVFSKITDINNWMPNITFLGAIKEISTGTSAGEYLLNGAGVLSILLAFAPVAMVTFAEHIADHKNISSIIEKDLLKDPGLDKTLLGDGIGTIGGALFGGCPNTTYGESIGCVAITGNASVWTTLTTAILCVVLAFFYPFILFIETIPACVVGGICIALYGFIAVSGLRMFKNVDLDNSKNLFIVAAIFVCGIGGLKLNFGGIEISNIATALILGIIVNLILKPSKEKVEQTVKVEEGEVEEKTIFGNIYDEKKEKGKDKNKSDKQ